MSGKLYHMGFRGAKSRSHSLADANEAHDWRIYADFAQVLIGIARPMYLHDPIGVDLDQSLYALDSTTIDLCLSLFPWAKFRKHKAAVKMHTLLDLHGNIPTFISITDGKVHDVNILDEILPEAGAFYVMDRGYVDFGRLYVFTLSAAFFVIRTKSNVLLQRRYSHAVDKTTGVHSDHTVVLTAIDSAQGLPGYTAPRQLSRSRKPRSGSGSSPTTSYFPHLPSPDLQVALAGGIVFQMDQTASADQGLLRHQRERREDPDLDAVSRLRAGRHHPQALGAGGQPLPDSTDFQRTLFEKTPILQALQAPDSEMDLADSGNQLILFEKYWFVAWPDRYILGGGKREFKCAASPPESACARSRATASFLAMISAAP